MNILFVTFGRLSIGAGALRSVSMLRALADAGSEVDVIAAEVSDGIHAHINILLGGADKPPSRRMMRRAVRHALKSKTYHVLHAVDYAAFYAVSLVKPRKMNLVYEASRCCTGPNGEAPCWHWKLFPTHYQRMERKVLRRAAMVFTACNDLSVDLSRISNDAHIVQIEDVPAQPLFGAKDADRIQAAPPFDGDVSFLVTCNVLSGNRGELRTLLLAARKVIDKKPGAGFVFKGFNEEEALRTAASLDIQGRCLFCAEDDTDRFLSHLAVSDAALFVPRPGCRYRHPDVLTMLNSPAIVVAIHESAYAAMLTDRNSLQVDYTATSIAEGLLRIIQEPLLAFGIAADAQQQIADHHSFSSFKHHVRMAYHTLAGAR